MIASRNQNQLQSFLAPLGNLLKGLMFLSNLNNFNSSPSPLVQGFARRKGSSKVWKEKGSKWFCHFSLSLLVFVCALLRCFDFMFWASLVFMPWLFNIFLFGYFFCFVLFCFSYKNFKKNWKIRKIQKQCVFCVLWYLCTLDGHWNKVF